MWKWSRPSIDGSHHVTDDGIPLYENRFDWVLPFHEPGLAPAGKDNEAFHIDQDGLPAYSERYSRTFGFYQSRAAVKLDDYWFHILPNESRLYEANWEWCGNFQNDRCPVRDHSGQYFHIRLDGSVVPNGPWLYAGDFREGVAVVRDKDGLCRHIDSEGVFIHDGAFFDLDVFHKGYARARDRDGWFHINTSGKEISSERFMMLEPFYNGQALARGFDTSIHVIDENMKNRKNIRSSMKERMEWFHDIGVSYWKPFALMLGIHIGLLGGKTKLHASPRGEEAVKNAWINMGLLEPDGIFLTDLGSIFARDKIVQDIIIYWMEPQFGPWLSAWESLEKGTNPDFFIRVSSSLDDIALTQRVLDYYARMDWSGIANEISLKPNDIVVDLGGGQGALLQEFQNIKIEMKGILVERPEVMNLVEPNNEMDVISADILKDELPDGDVYVLSRVLHDWDDESAIRILRNVSRIADANKRLFVIDRVCEKGKHGLLDLNMYLTTGGKERSMDEWALLFEETGWSVYGITEFNGHHIFELRKENQ